MIFNGREGILRGCLVLIVLIELLTINWIKLIL